MIDELGQWVGPPIQNFDSTFLDAYILEDSGISQLVIDTLLNEHQETLRGPQGVPGDRGPHGDLDLQVRLEDLVRSLDVR